MFSVGVALHVRSVRSFVPGAPPTDGVGADCVGFEQSSLVHSEGLANETPQFGYRNHQAVRPKCSYINVHLPLEGRLTWGCLLLSVGRPSEISCVLQDDVNNIYLSSWFCGSTWIRQCLQDCLICSG